MNAQRLKANQTKLKKDYSDDPQSAIQKLSAIGIVDFDNLACNLVQPKMLSPAGLHPGSGGNGRFACPVEIMLAGWVGCIGITLAAVSHSMKLAIESCEISAIGTIDFKGTLAVDRNAPVGLTQIRLQFRINSSEPQESIDKLIQLTKRYCVVHQTMEHMPQVEFTIQAGNAGR